MRGLEREDLFTVVFDQVMTDTAMYADVVLPATTFLEHYDFARGYGPITLQLGKPVIDAVGESRSNTDVFMDLARRLDLTIDGDPDGRARSDAERARRAAGEDRRRASRSTGWPSRRMAAGRSSSSTCFRRPPIARCDLFPHALDQQAPIGLYGYQPDPATKRISARADLAGERSHDQLDARRAAAAGGAARDESGRCGRRAASRRATRSACGTRSAKCASTPRVSPLVKRGIVAMPKGVWRRNTKNGYTSNALVPDTLADLGGGACFNDARVQVERSKRSGERE